MMTHEDQQEQISEEEQEDHGIEAFGLNPPFQKVIWQLLSKAKEKKKSKGKSRTATTAFQDSAGASKIAKNTSNNDHQIIRLIDLYEERAYLWDIFDNEYHNKHKCERTLYDMSHELEIPVANMKSKFLSLCWELSRERAKVSKTTSCQSLDDIYKPT